MAVVYYPNDQKLYSKDTAQGNYQSLVLASSPNVVLYFGTASTVSSASAMDLTITCSWARSASVSNVYNTFTSGSWTTQSLSASYALNADIAVSSSWASASVSSSYAGTASFAVNGGGGGGLSTASAYTTLTTSSNYGITASFTDVEEYVSIVVGALYYFTCSNMPSANTASNTSLYIKNTASSTSSLSFPASWTFIGIVPTYLTASKSAVLSLKAFGPEIVAAWGAQY